MVTIFFIYKRWVNFLALNFSFTDPELKKIHGSPSNNSFIFLLFVTIIQENVRKFKLIMGIKSLNIDNYKLSVQL